MVWQVKRRDTMDLYTALTLMRKGKKKKYKDETRTSRSRKDGLGDVRDGGRKCVTRNKMKRGNIMSERQREHYPNIQPAQGSCGPNEGSGPPIQARIY